MIRSLEDALIPVVSTGWTMSEIDGELHALPSVALDVAKRPDVEDLARVHATEGIGEIRTLATPAGGGNVRFDVVITSPVQCHLAFIVDDVHQAVLDEAAKQETLVLATGDPSIVGATWLAVNIDGDALQAVLASC